MYALGAGEAAPCTSLELKQGGRENGRGGGGGGL